ncbi:MAG: PAS domain-containing protein [Deltaproteobacteria bacterium]|jgi:two-component system sensor histidine kinase PilS (NtrC family)|nr:PAS domain-containing protein [Deltaproteobacteria bacterium]
MQWFPLKIEEGRQKRLFIFRLMTNIFLSLLVILIHLNGSTPDIFGFWPNVIVLVMVGSFILAVADYILWPKFLGPGGQIIVQVVTDVIWASALIVLTGGFDSALLFLFIIVVINSAFLGGLRVSFIAATLSTFAWAGIVDLHYYGYLPGLPPLGEFLSPAELAVNILVNTGASYMVAILGGHLSTQLEISSQALVKSQSSLDRLSELNDNIVHSIDSGLITTDNQDRVLSINQAAREILRVSSGEVIGRSWRFFLPELNNVERLPLKHPHHRRVDGGLRFKHFRPVDQEELILELDTLALVDENNEPWGRLMVLKDLTAISALEAEIQRNEHMAAMGKLAAGLAHEIRTPLASMKGSWHMILGGSLAEEDTRRLMMIIGREMERLDHLVNEFLAFARPSTGNPQPIELYGFMEDQLKVLESAGRGETEVELEREDVPPVYFDPDKLRQIVWNLLQNAAEARDPERRLKITVSLKNSENPPGNVSLTVEDNGKGIEEERLRHIFEPFYTTKPKGTGLGLATAWSLLQKGNGGISVSTSPNKGTAFTLSLPRYTAAEGKTEALYPSAGGGEFSGLREPERA